MLSIAAILKNEHPFILEWLAYHMVLGIKEFYIADNISTDGSSELLYYLDKAKFIKRLEHPTENGSPPQLSAYSKILSIVDKNKWVAFIDADEFISPNDYEDGLDKIIPLLNDQSNGGISLNWAVYGSSYSILPGEGFLTERFTKRAAESHPVNKHYKSIVRVGDVLNTGPTPHAFKIKSDKKFIMPNGAIQEKNDGISETVDWSLIRLNHYVIKSRAEFFNKKASRGRATTLKESLGRNIQFFRNHDLNEIDQHIPSWFINKVRTQVNKIQKSLIECGHQLVVENIKEPFYRTSKKMGVGVIDTFNVSDNILTLKGWAVDNEKEKCTGIAIVINNSILLHPSTTSFYDRPDVQRAGIGNGLGCGFISTIALPDISISDVNIYSVNKFGLACVEFSINEKITDYLVENQSEL